MLNAFRHHCSFHKILRARGNRFRPVLNAFRHHCSFHSFMLARSRVRPLCSTPFGIIVRSTTKKVHELPAVSVLNAFRHHCSFHPLWSRRTGSSIPGAQRLSASLFVPRRCAWKILRGAVLCSTPFGIIVRSTHLRVSVAQRELQCSTPFGIIVRSTLVIGVFASAANVCSTPFGIIVRSTVCLLDWPEGLHPVLNAFRHHCSFHTMPRSPPRPHVKCSTPFGIIVRSTLPDFALSRAYPCAQRLSASLFVPPRPRPTPARIHSVLNAFRHHCSFHSLPLVRLPWPLVVLNAFRHHCSFHLSEAEKKLMDLECSTPFGIIVRSTTNFAPLRCGTLPCAQRLSASLFVPLRRMRGRRRGGSVLNAFRHHCSFH